MQKINTLLKQIRDEFVELKSKEAALKQTINEQNESLSKLPETSENTEVLNAQIKKLEQENMDLLTKTSFQGESLETRFKELATLTQMLEDREAALEQLQQRVNHLEQRNQQLHVSLMSSRLDDYKAILANSALFDADWYLTTYSDVQESGMPAEEHYILHGAFELRNPGPDFDTAWYLNYRDVSDSLENPLIHYLQVGKAQGLLATEETEGVAS